MNGEIVPHQPAPPGAPESQPLSISAGASLNEIISVMRLVDQALEQVLEEGLDKDFATIPGTPKPTLLQAGAEKLAAIFNLGILLDTKINDLPGGHREVIVTASCVQRSTGKVVGQGVGSCTTMESRYRYRVAPKNPTNRPVPQEYWKHWRSDPEKAQAALGGPGFGKMKHNDQWVIAEGGGERVEHDNPSDYHNTVLKIASKRAMVSAIKTTTSTSGRFAVDIEESAIRQPPDARQEAPAQEAAPEPSEEERRAARPAEEPEPAQKPEPVMTWENVGTTWENVGIKDTIEEKTPKGQVYYVVLLSDGRKAWTYDGYLAQQIAKQLFCDLQVKPTAKGGYEVISWQEPTDHPVAT